MHHLNCGTTGVRGPRVRSATSSGRIGLAVFVTTAAALITPAALADSTPVGPLPPGTTTTWTAPRGMLVAIAAPRRNPSTGLVWRVARPIKGTVLRQVGEADVGPSTVLVFRAVGRGKTTVALALTKGDTSANAVASLTWIVKVT